MRGSPRISRLELTIWQGRGWPTAVFRRVFEGGFLRAIPVSGAGIVDVVPIDYVADAVLAMHAGAMERGSIHLVAGASAITVSELASIASRELDLEEVTFGFPEVSAGLEALLPFASHLDVEATFDCQNAQARLAPLEIVPPPLIDYFVRLIDYARRSRWGKRRLTRQAAALPAQRSCVSQTA